MSEVGGVEGCKHSHQVLTYTYQTGWCPVISQTVLDSTIDPLFQSILTTLSFVIVFFPKTSVISEINECLFFLLDVCFWRWTPSPSSGTEFFLDFSDTVSCGCPLIWPADQSVPALVPLPVHILQLCLILSTWLFSLHSVTLKTSHNLMALAFTRTQLFPHIGIQPYLPFLLISV